ncbi:YqaA family protein [Cellvibrio sp. NN19]|uniref:YqaA family protein n=1 Tax=Cellvibrio chitinivorans TaxID=3102792 RepID=UPI002B413593|nr:YqaA family protein [Cellvibrio sp. NN19]
MAYLSLFFSALIAATLFPLSSEALLATLLYQKYSPILLWIVATSGNTLGSCINWYLGKACLHWRDEKWFPVNANQLAKAQQQFERYGVYSLLFSWLPIIGDPLTFIAGIMRIPFWKFVVLVSLGKGLRYAVVIAIALGFLN